MTYKVHYTKKAIKELKKLGKHTRTFILAWIQKNLEDCSNPRHHGKGLVSNLSGQWRYRVGDYRILAEIEDDKIIILILTIGHRRDVYN